MLMTIGLTDLMPKPMRILRSSCARTSDGVASAPSAGAPMPCTTLRRLIIVYLSLVLSAIDPMDQ